MDLSFPSVHLSPVKADGKVLVSSRPCLPRVASALARAVIFYRAFLVPELEGGKELQNFFRDTHPLGSIFSPRHLNTMQKVYLKGRWDKERGVGSRGRWWKRPTKR